MYFTWLRATANVDEMASSFSFVVERSNPIQSKERELHFLLCTVAVVVRFTTNVYSRTMEEEGEGEGEEDCRWM